VVETKEVRQEIKLWRDAIAGEVGSLVENGAIKIYDRERGREYLREHPAATSYPAKPVFVAKKTGKKKRRVVICGNFITAESNENTYSSTPDATGVRLVLRLGAFLDEVDIEELRRKGVDVEEIERSMNEEFNGKIDVASVDVSTAFLNADLSPEDLSKGICTRPPKILIEAGLAREGDLWVLKKALYGLRTAPRYWSMLRNRVLSEIKIPTKKRNVDSGRAEVGSRTVEDS
jgi:hypothetical protein